MKRTVIIAGQILTFMDAVSWLIHHVVFTFRTQQFVSTRKWREGAGPKLWVGCDPRPQPKTATAYWCIRSYPNVACKTAVTIVYHWHEVHQQLHVYQTAWFPHVIASVCDDENRQRLDVIYCRNNDELSAWSAVRITSTTFPAKTTLLQH